MKTAMRSLMSAFTLIAAFATAQAQAAIEVAGTKFETSAQVAGQNLVLNGAGLRTFVILNVYAAGLYVPHKDSTAAGLINQSGAKAVRLVMLRNLTSDEFTNAMIKGFTANQTPETQPKLQARMEDLRALMASFGEAKKGWVVEIDYVPGTGTRFFLNGEQKGKDIAGEDFYQALLKIWLGNHPVDNDLKRSLVGANSTD